MSASHRARWLAWLADTDVEPGSGPEPPDWVCDSVSDSAPTEGIR